MKKAVILLIAIIFLSGCKENKLSNKKDMSQNAFSEIFKKKQTNYKSM